MQHFLIMTRVTFRYCSGFWSILWQHIRNMCLVGFFNGSFQHTASCLFMVISVLCTQPTVWRLEMQAQKKSPHFWSGRRNTSTFKHYERLWYQQVFGGVCTNIHNANLLKKVVEGMNDGACVCTVQQVHQRWTTLKKNQLWCKEAKWHKLLRLFHFSVFWHDKQHVLIRICMAACKQNNKWNIYFH